MAVAQVFDTKELLEAILKELHIIKLFTVQRVCVAWRDTIERSPSLQQALFMRPVGPVLQNFVDRGEWW